MSAGATFVADVLVVGAGAAGLATALGLRGCRVHVLTKGRAGASGSSPHAQGGIAAALGPDDSPAVHAADTLAVAGGLADADLVDTLTREGPAAVLRLVVLGARFDRTADGSLALRREAAHGRRRIVHARDATGAELMRALRAALEDAEHVRVFEQTRAAELLIDGGRVVGVRACDATGDVVHLARAVVFATGGLGHLYAHTTNPPEATGDGLALAARAGARLVDLEFVQFHPTALAVGADPMPLVTEALRGHGAHVVDESGRRFLFDADPAGELAARDVVARAIAAHVLAGGGAYLDAREAVGDDFPRAFPTVFELCHAHGLDPRCERIPVAPAAHFHMGGIAVDGRGRTSLPGLWACGEVASTGVHGANRLASNSLLEALVFGARAADDIARHLPDRPPARDARRATGDTSAVDVQEIDAELRALMWRDVGLLRDVRGLARALARLEQLARECPGDALETRNMLSAARLVTRAALARRESRGSHFRRDHPHADPAFARRLFFVGESGQPDDGGARPESAVAPRPAPLEVVS